MSRPVGVTQGVSRNSSIAANPEWRFPYNDPVIDGFQDLWNNMDSSKFQGFDGIDSTDHFIDPQFGFQDCNGYFGTDANGSADNANQLNVTTGRRASAQMITRPFAAVPLDTQNVRSSINYCPHAPAKHLQHPSYRYNARNSENAIVEQVQQPYYNHPATYVYDSDLQPTVRPDAIPNDNPRRTSTATTDLSEDSSLKKTRRTRTKHINATFLPEKPKTDERAWWVRINGITEGKTSRTGKINQYDADEVYGPLLPHPLGNWTGRKTSFGYNKYGELSEKTYTARQIREFLFEHPQTKDCKLKLWIQRSPADSARRYRTPNLSKCRFKDCPVQRDMKGSILHGQYRVAFDEKWYKYRLNADPFLTAGYVHLYCMERFLDFPEICKKLDVEVDVRHMVNEPKQHFAATLAGSIEANIVLSFLEACREGQLEKKYPDYPLHKDYSHGDPKPHEHTLTYAMNKAKLESRPRAQIRQFEARGVLDSNVVVHLGDLEKFVAARAKKRQPKKSMRKHNREVDSDSEVEEKDEIVVRPRKQRRTKVVQRTPRDHMEQPVPAVVPTSHRRNLRTLPPINYTEPGPSPKSLENPQNSLFVSDYHQFPTSAPQTQWDLFGCFDGIQPAIPLQQTEQIRPQPLPSQQYTHLTETDYNTQLSAQSEIRQDLNFSTYGGYFNSGYDYGHGAAYLPRRVSRFESRRRPSSASRKVITGERKESSRWIDGFAFPHDRRLPVILDKVG
ncbi:hypothetical protein AOQ84DRAFT_443941 [Glonium stellatum]|uniref:Uncharacterized protein n=1 Tax=Glonium stellatum TaxID=574774 RepID=A0A8E2EMU1_9PEZI|nr:hypothetical protein AOQ84DRAFT_443941 [Glonium stellatum]